MVSYRVALLATGLGFLQIHLAHSAALPQRVSPAPETSAPAIFSEQAAALGVDFVYFNGRSGEYYMPEINGAGVALIDYDNDDDLDLFFVQGGMLGPGKEVQDALDEPPHPPPFRHRLYRNDLTVHPDGRRALGFTDVSERAGLVAAGYGQGVATGDYDNDGFMDLYVTGIFQNQLLRNNGDGTFGDVTAEAGVDDARWSVPATFFDFDGDGWLDLYVGNYNDWSYENNKNCLRVTGAEDYCGPRAYDPVTDRLFRNDKDGTFTDVTQRSGLLTAFGPALGVIAADFSGDGRLDLFVANDQHENNLWIQQSDRTFSDEALVRGVAVNEQGFSEASMGVAAEDFDGDGDLDLFLTHLLGETNTYYRNDGRGMFTDASIISRLGPPSKWATGFGVLPIDYDNDGWLDILTVNGEVRVIEELARQGDSFPLHQPNQLFHNEGGGRFREVSREAGPAFQLSEVSRGIALGDLDNDGDSDVVIANNGGPARILINERGSASGWLGLRLLGADGKRDALGAQVELHRDGQPTLVRHVHTDGSYASGNDPRVLFGLGSSREYERIRVTWPNGRMEEWTELPTDTYSTLRQGTGKAIPASRVASDTSPESPD